MLVGVHNTKLSVNVLIAEFHCSKEDISFNYILEELFKFCHSGLHAVVCTGLTGALLSSREHTIAPGLLSAALLGCGTSQRKLVNTTDEKRLVEKEKMAFLEVSSTLSRLGPIGLFCLFSVLRRKHDICWPEKQILEE